MSLAGKGLQEVNSTAWRFFQILFAFLLVRGSGWLRSRRILLWCAGFSHRDPPQPLKGAQLSSTKPTVLRTRNSDWSQKQNKFYPFRFWPGSLITEKRERIAAAIETAAANLVTTLCCGQTGRRLKPCDVPRSTSNRPTTLKVVCKATKIPQNTSLCSVSKLFKADTFPPPGTSRQEMLVILIFPKGGYNLLCISL